MAGLVVEPGRVGLVVETGRAWLVVELGRIWVLMVEPGRARLVFGLARQGWWWGLAGPDWCLHWQGVCGGVCTTIHPKDSLTVQGDCSQRIGDPLRPLPQISLP